MKLLKIKEGKLDQNMINLFGKLISLRNLNSGDVSSASTIFKESV